MKRRSPGGVDTFVGQRIREARLVAQVTQTEMADMLGISFQQVQKYEKGSNRVAPSRLALIAEKTGRPIGWFYPDADNVAAGPDPLREFAQTARAIAFARDWNDIQDPTMREALADMAAALARAERARRRRRTQAA